MSSILCSPFLGGELKPAPVSLKWNSGSLHLILIHDCVLERFIQDHFLPREFLGVKGSVANHSACLKTPYNRFFFFFFFFKLETYFHSATEGDILSRCGLVHMEISWRCVYFHVHHYQNIFFLLRWIVKNTIYPQCIARLCRGFELGALHRHVCFGNIK